MNALIRAAEQKALQEEAEFGVALNGEGWQDMVRSHMGGGASRGEDEFSALSSHVASSRSKMPDKERHAARVRNEAEETAYAAAHLVAEHKSHVSTAADEFGMLVRSGGGGGSSGGGAKAGGPAGAPPRTAGASSGLSSATAGGGLSRPAAPASMGGMGRYAMHRI